MQNPFHYGSVVLGDAFCNRTQELTDLRRAMENGAKLFVYSERRVGKTSLVKQALHKLPKKEFVGAYVDLWPTDGSASFVAATAKAIATATATPAAKMLELAKTLFSHLAPRITLDDEGKPEIDFGVRRAGTPELDEVLSAPAKLARQQGRRAVIVFDECQRILEYDGDLVERRLRSTIQHHTDVAYIFLGSRKHLIQQMFLDKSRPLYRSAGHYPLRPIHEKHWVPFIQKRFHDADKRITADEARALCRLTEGHPFYTQHLCHTLWEMVETGGQVTDEAIQQSVAMLLDRESYAYTTLWESLTKNQQRFLRGLAHESAGVKPFAATFTRRWGLQSASNAQRAVEGLIEKDLIDRENGSFVIVDRFLRLWVRRFASRV